MTLNSFLGLLWWTLALLMSLIFFFPPVVSAEERGLLMANLQPAETLDDPNFTFDLNVITDQGITGTVRQRWVREGVNYFLGRVIGFLAGVVGGLAVLMMSYGGFLMLSSAGSEDQYQKGVDYLKYSAMGLAAVLSAYILVNAVQLLIRSIYA